VSVALSVFLLGLCADLAQAQRKARRKQSEETPNERFYRKGGKSTKADIIVQAGALTTATIIQERNLALYDDGGHSNCRAGMVRFRSENASDFSSENCSISKVRDFLWQHWQEKKRGYVRISFDSVDAVSTSHIFVEPDQNGRWHVVWRIVRHSEEITDLPDIISIERAKHKRTDYRGGSYILVFRNDEGGEMQRL
jgi:hypothetical protein